MSLYAGLEDMKRRREEIRRTQGDKAAEEYDSGVLGAGIGGADGMLTGMALGTAVCPGAGTVAGGLIGWFIGANNGSKDKTSGDNLKRAARTAIFAGLHNIK